MKRFVLLLAAAIALGTGCARKTAVPPVNDTLSRHLLGDPATLDPIVTAEELGLRLEEMIFRPLVGIDKSRRFVPALAKSWAASSDGLAYDFRLDPEARWEDGTPVTSADVAFTIERVRDPKVPAVTWRAGFDDLRSVETPDASTVIVRFSKPYAQRLFAFTLPVVSAAAYGKPGASPGRQPVGSGPYRLESWTTNQTVVLVRREDAKPELFPFRRMIFRILPDANVAFRAGSAGDLDEFLVSRDQQAQALKSPEFGKKNRIVQAPQFLVVLLYWNLRNPILAELAVRQALAHGWNRADTAKRLYPPNGAALASGPYPPSAVENAADLKPPSWDPAESARLLEGAGWRPGPDGIRRKGSRRLSFEVLYGPSTMTSNLLEIYRGAAQKIGVEILPRRIEWAAYSARLSAGEFDATMSALQYFPPNLDMYPYFHSSQAPPNGQNVGFYRNAEADKLMEAWQREMDESKRLELSRQIHRVLAANPPADFMWDADQPWAVSKRLDGVEISATGLFHFLPGPLAWRPIPPRAR
jgi:peptide/nickel transport system substrate-binding protein